MILNDKEILELLIRTDEGYILNNQERQYLASVNSLTIDNSFSKIPKSIVNLSSLESLCLGTSDASSLPQSIGELTNLKFLFCHGSKLKRLPDSIGNLRNLVVFDLSSTLLTELPTSFCNLSSLEDLDLSNSPIARIPNSFGNLSSLRKLDISNTPISVLPNSFGNLSSLEELDLSSTRLTELPNSFVDLIAIKKLVLQGVPLTGFPSQVTHLLSLETLNLATESITDIPDSLGHLTSLKRLNLKNTSLSLFPAPLLHLSSLESLNLSGIPLKRLPENFGCLSSLKRLYLSNTLLEALPNSFRQLQELTTLDLTSTKLSELPRFILQFKNLTVLRIANTMIKELPEDGWDLLDLVDLDLSGLSLSNIPQSLALSKYAFFTVDNKKHGILLHNTHLDDYSIEVFLQSPTLISDLYSNDQIMLNECKVIFLGDGDSGKSYTIKRLENQGKIENPDNLYITKETPGIEISDYKVESEGNLCLHFWDFGGQELLHSMHRCFLTEKTCYVITVKSRETQGNERALYWLKNVLSFAPDSPILLYINCWDNDDGKRVIDERRLTKEFPNIKEVIYCSAKTSDDQTFNQSITNGIINLVRNSGYLEMKANRKWYSVQKELQAKASKQKYLTKKEYHEICLKHGIKNAQNNDLLTFFNNLGVCFSYHLDKDKKELAEYKLLDPRWLTNAMSAIFEEGERESIEGKITVASITRLLCTPANPVTARRPDISMIYSLDECGYIIDVATAYNLCYKINEETLFFPALCKKNTPKEALSFRERHPNCSEYDFSYTFLPDSLIHQLMIRLKNNGYALSNCWFHGMLINIINQYDILIYKSEHSLSILVSSESHAVSDIFPMMRELIVATNDSLNLRPKEQIQTSEDVFSVIRLIKAKEEAKKEIEGEKYGNSVDTYLTLSVFYSPMDISRLDTNGQDILWRDSAFHAADKNNEIVRYGIYRAYDGKCQYCGLPLYFKEMQIDHILPEKSEKYFDQADPQVKSYIKYLQDNGFNLESPDYLENYFLSCGPDNNCKKADIRSYFALHEYHATAIKKVPCILRFMKQYEKERLCK